MPNVDVTELFYDPDFASSICLIKYKQVMDNHGRAQNVPTKKNIVGVIQPARPSALKQLPDSSQTAGAVEIWCQEPLDSGKQGTAADEVIWLGQNYKVASVQAWANEGGGSFWHAVAEQLPLVDSEQDYETT